MINSRTFEMNVKCAICGHNRFFAVHLYGKPDAYERLAGIQEVDRCWIRCFRCGFYRQIQNYELSDLQKIYVRGYRDEAFRGESIERAFERINAIENNENEARYIWFAMNVNYERNRRVLDIGSGIGVWPYILQNAGYDVTCVEENEISIEFITKMGIKCFQSTDSISECDTVTLVHVLEHIEQPEALLAKIKKLLRKGGTLFVEVPDSSEFSYLDKNHDEFNSCHLVFYNMSSLYKTLERAGFTAIDMHLEKTEQRDLSRVMCLAVN